MVEVTLTSGESEMVLRARENCMAAWRLEGTHLQAAKGTCRERGVYGLEKQVFMVCLADSRGSLSFGSVTTGI